MQFNTGFRQLQVNFEPTEVDPNIVDENSNINKTTDQTELKNTNKSKQNVKRRVFGLKCH